MDDEIPPVGTSGPLQQPPLLRAGGSIAGSPIRFLGNQMWIKLATEQVASEFSIMENAIASHNGPPLHVHPFEEFFYILKSTFVFEVDGKPMHVGAGDFVHVGGNLPHVFQNTSDEEGRVLLIARPAGVEKYFMELGQQAVNNPGDIAAINALGLRYGIKALGPPIAARNKPAAQ